MEVIVSGFQDQVLKGTATSFLSSLVNRRVLALGKTSCYTTRTLKQPHGVDLMARNCGFLPMSSEKLRPSEANNSSVSETGSESSNPREPSK